MSSRSPKRDHVNAFAGFQVHDRNSHSMEQTQGDETLLPIGKSVVFVGRREPFKYAPGVGEVKPVIPEICCSLTLIPRKAHLPNVYTHGKTVKPRLMALRTRYRITSSARASSDAGIVRPSVLAVFMLITSSNFVGCSTGRSAGLAPLKIRST